MAPTPLPAFDGDHQGYENWSRALHIRLTEGNLECLWAIAGDLFEAHNQERLEGRDRLRRGAVGPRRAVGLASP